MSATPVERLNAALEGRYRIESELGEGGMATVYLADDLKHERKVALKVLKPELAAVVGAERFLAEIKTTANLQHPHILPLFDSGEADTYLFYVMPYVEGETLRDRLDREKQLPVDEAVRIATEVAESLDYAHGRNVIHRDIKPENVLLQNGRAVVADFGIALAVSAGGGTRLTETGLSLGTPAYMSPEQATGDREVDGRSDVYALGCLLYEMLSGEPPHHGSTAQAVLASVLTKDPVPLSIHRPKVPRPIESAINAAISRIPADRPESGAQFVTLLTQAAETPPGSTRRLAYAAIVGALILAAFTAGVAVPREQQVISAPPARRQVTFFGESSQISLSPDGDRLVYAAVRCQQEGACRSELMLQDIAAGGNPVVIEPFPAAYGAERDWYWSTEWSPAGDQLILTRARPGIGDGVYLMPPNGGAAQMLRNETAVSAVFRPDGGTVDWIGYPDGFIPGSGLWRTLDLETDSVTSSRTLPFDAKYLNWSPDGDLVAMIGGRWDGVDTKQLLALARPDGTVTDTLVVPGRIGWPRVHWVDNAVVYVRDDDLYRHDVNHAAGTFAAEPQLVVEGLDRSRWGQLEFAMSADGDRLVWVAGNEQTSVYTMHDGEVNQIQTGTAFTEFPSISPDGTSLAYIREDAGGSNIYIQPFEGGDERPLTGTSTERLNTEWSPDSRHIAFIEVQDDGDWLSVVTVGEGRPRRLAMAGTRAEGHRFGWAPSSDAILFTTPDGQVARAVLEGGMTVLFPLPEDSGILWDLLVSPDGDSVATFSHLFAGDHHYLVHSSSISSGDWRLRLDVSGYDFDLNVRPAGRRFLGEWRSQSPLYWYEDGRIEVGLGNNNGSVETAAIWSLSLDPDGDHRRLIELTDPCGAPTTITATKGNTHVACTRRAMSADVWVMDGLRGAR